MSDIKQLNQKRGQLSSQLTRFETFVNGINPSTSRYEVSTRLEKIETVWSEFAQCQSDIELIDSSEEQLNYRDTFENKFYKIVARAKEYLFNSQSTSSSSNNSLTKVKLPTLKLPEFSGLYSDYIQFYDSFNALVNNNSELTDVQRFYYLKSCLKGYALQVVQSLEVTDANYNIAWSLLKERYENKRIIINSHLKNLFDLPILLKESAKDLRKFLDEFLKNIRALQNLGEPVDKWNSVMIYLLSNKLDPITKREWESSLNTNDMPELQLFSKFLTQRSHILEAVGSQSTNVKQKGLNLKHEFKTLTHLSTSKHRCEFCKESHFIYNCQKFKELPVQSRVNEIKQLKLCTNCFRSNHKTSECVSVGCKRCNRKHNTILHLDTNNNNNIPNIVNTRDLEIVQGSPSNDNHLENETNVLCSSNSSNNNCNYNTVLLSTAIIEIYDNNNFPIKCRALLDSGSMSNFITKNLLSKLKLPVQQINLPIFGINNSASCSRVRTAAKIKSLYTSYSTKIPFLVLDNITGNIPQFDIPISKLTIPTDIQLADPQFNKSSHVDMLIGAQIYQELMCVGQIRINKNQPVYQKTMLGWIISGQLTTIHNIPRQLSLLSTNDLNNQLEKFWQIEDNHVKSKIFTREESRCEEHFTKTVTRNKSGRFVVSLPLKYNFNFIGTEDIAKKRLLSLEKRFNTNPELKQHYCNFMNEYISLNHMTKIEPPNIKTNNITYYMPHHGVLKQSSRTTKLRVVFNASQSDTQGKSLNDVLLVGPSLQDDIFSIINRFRKHNYVIIADITKMYRQIIVNKYQRDLQRIVWRNNPNDEISHYQLNTVTYGTGPASFIATRCLKQIALENQDNYPQTCQTIVEDFYMDDVISGSNSIENTKILKTELEGLLNSYGFELRQWLSNHPSILSESQINNEIHHYYLTDDKTVKTLGVLWNSKADILQYSFNSDKSTTKVTKRIILAVISKIFDPLGLIGPIIITAKIMIQQLWKLKIGWDESIPQNLYTLWLKFYDQLPSINAIQFPRQVLISNYIEIQLHGFSDASITAYGACIYIRSSDSYGNHYSRLLTAKSRVAPLKSITLPRLELCGALLLAKLQSKVIQAMNINFKKIFYWSDSEIVLSWLSVEPATWKTFVCNRVAEIQELTKNGTWNYIKSNENPSDIISRGCTPNELIKSSLWLNGPPWLRNVQSEWPTAVYTHVNLEKANKTQTYINNLDNDQSILLKYSSFDKLNRVVAYILRFINNTRVNKRDRTINNLKINELDQANKLIVTLIQNKEFYADKISLKKSKMVAPKSKLSSLNPFLDSDDIIRVGGRLGNSKFDYSKRHPIVLPKHHVTNLIIDCEHKRLLHAGAQHVLASLRNKYWPLNGRNAVRLVLHKCIVCYRANPRVSTPLMGELPSNRVTYTRPFETSGVDCAGPFLIKDGKTRNRKIVKTYVCLFICFNTKAVHLELAGDLTTESFLNALKRFIARRGLCKQIYSDNATNFIGANNELRKVNERLNQLTNDLNVHRYLINNKITWKFIPPQAPHFGGLWERAIRSVKHHLKRILNIEHMDFEQFYTLLTRIESILNSRPLCPLSNDPNDLEPLTPGHFLIGTQLTSIPEDDFTAITNNKLTKYQRQQQWIQHFWNRWSDEYINNLQQRTKWKFPNEGNLAINKLVLIKDDNLPVQQWKLGRIIACYPGRDGIVRTAEIRTSNGVLKRAFSRVCILPID